MGVLAIFAVPFTATVLEDEWEKILKIKSEVKSQYTDSYEGETYCTDSYLYYILHYITRIYAYLLGSVGFAVVIVLGLYFAYNILSSLTFSAVIVIVLTFIAFQLYDINSKMH